MKELSSILILCVLASMGYADVNDDLPTPPDLPTARAKETTRCTVCGPDCDCGPACECDAAKASGETVQISCPGGRCFAPQQQPQVV